MNALRTDITDYRGEYVCLTNKKRPISLYKFRCGTLKSPTAEQLYHAIDNFQHVTSTSISCLVLSEIVSVSRMLQTETLDFSPANRYVDDLLDKLEQQKYDAQDYFHNVVYRHVDQFII
ncbi:unnamed protein product [Rotaria magnacalcarata]|uniref:Uncharacterized protein n=1 Tax=Rotaria magnacalcarata TaxID=392030 RepID=A0A815U3S0_9BILA|nr:unnamed protein product [Rotaria magnacalcarata]